MIATCRSCGDPFCDLCEQDICGCTTGLCHECAQHRACAECREPERGER